jgi:aspartate racemase
MKTIGVVGGIGPQATMDFEARLHRAAQGRVAPKANGGYPPMIVYYHRRPPMLVGEDLLPVLPLRIDPELREAVTRLGPQVDFLVITSNGAHALSPEIERAAGRPVLNMMDLAVAEARRRGWKKVGVLSLGRLSIYADRLGEAGMHAEFIPAEQQAHLDRAIFRVMEGRDDEPEREAARQALATLRSRGVDGVIVGCTEVPFLLAGKGGERDLIDPLELLAEAALERALAQGGS